MELTAQTLVTAGTTFIVIIVLAFAITYVQSWTDAGRATRSLLDTHTHTDTEKETEREIESDPDNDYYERLIKRASNNVDNSDAASSGGRTEKYEWTQTADEVEVLVPLIHCVDNAHTLSARDVSVTITSKALKIIVKGEILLEGVFCAAVRSEESCWLLDRNAQGEPLISLHLEKLTPAVKKNQFWRCLLQGDAEINVGGNVLGEEGPSVHRLDPSDPASVRSALKQFKEQRM